MTAGITEGWQHFREPLWQTLIRNVLIAVVVGTIVSVRRGNLSSIGPFTLLAMWFTLGGHYVEVAFLNGIRSRLPKNRGLQLFGRLVFWFVGGCLLYLGMTMTARLFSIKLARYPDLWIGGFLLIGIELVAHLAALLRRKPNFYLGTG